jgi:hypothetical protein
MTLFCGTHTHTQTHVHTCMFVCVCVCVYARAGVVPRLNHDRFLQNPFQIIIHPSSIHLTLHKLATECVVKQPTKYLYMCMIVCARAEEYVLTS